MRLPTSLANTACFWWLHQPLALWSVRFRASPFSLLHPFSLPSIEPTSATCSAI
ncbi:AgrD family cyclic lactone autoinducer peptide [Marinobacter sp.]|uniref:AgrD family cyclic lactone autoinducer peptide n=1 Tax=Marinobacter sp. TaxID=50741 RepID=UPI00349FE4E6